MAFKWLVGIPIAKLNIIIRIIEYLFFSVGVQLSNIVCNYEFILNIISNFRVFSRFKIEYYNVTVLISDNNDRL